MTTILLVILSLPFAALFLLWLSARAIHTPWQTVPEAAVRTLSWAARWMTALAEAADNAVTQASHPPKRTACELAREAREANTRIERENTEYVERTKRELQPIPGGIGRLIGRQG